MPAVEFVDTNIWVYAHLDDPHDPRCEQAWGLVRHHLTAPAISAQVVAEYVNVMRRNGVEQERMQRNIARMLEQCTVQPLNEGTIRQMLFIHNRYGLSIWDSQIVAAALAGGCRTLYSEDLQDGQRIETLTVVNPFRGDLA